MQLYTVLSYLYPEIVWGPQSTDCIIIDDAMAVWDAAKLGPQPTQAQLEAAWPAAQLKSLQVAQNALNYASYLQAIQEPVSYTSAGGVTALYKANAKTITNLYACMATYQLKQATPAGFYWKAADGSKVPFTFADLMGLAEALGEPAEAAWVRMQDLEDQVAAATISTVTSIIF